jgi:membrane-bound serine protease (ClpP class)
VGVRAPSAGRIHAVPVIALLLLTALLAFVATGGSGDLGSEYCGVVEKKYGVVGREGPHDRVVGPGVYVIRIEGVMGSWAKQYLVRALREAESRGYPLVVELNTPGGLVDVATDMVSEIARSRVPVIGYVVGKWAESAGTMILVSTHIAAMQPGTIIGSLQPVVYDPASGRYTPVNETKIVNPIIRTLCEHGAAKGRNATALVRFVLYNDNYGASDALRYGVVDVVAHDRVALIREVDGLIVALYAGERVKLELDGSYELLGLSTQELLLKMLSDPLVSGVLLSVGVLALVYSVASANVPGVALGLLFVLLGLLGSGLNPNMASIALIFIGATLILVELATPGFGVIGGTGVVMLVLGVALLPTPGGGAPIADEYLNRLLLYIYAMGLGAGVATAVLVYKVVRVARAKPYIWRLEGNVGEALDDIAPGKPGYVVVEGEYWKAESVEEIRKGEKVVVEGREGSVLRVRKAPKS